MLRASLFLTVCVVAVGAYGQEAPSSALLPNSALVEHLAPQPSAPELTAEGTTETVDSFITLTVPDVPPDSVHAERTAEGTIEQPVASANRLTVLFNPGLTPEEADQALAEYGLTRIEEEETAGLRHIGGAVVDASRGMEGEGSLTLDTPEALAETPIMEIARRLQADPRFVAATADALLTSQQIRSVVEPQLTVPASADASPAPQSTSPNRGTPAVTAAAPADAMPGEAAPAPATAEQVDWGIEDTRIDDLWPELGGDFRVGVIDVGFADHEDLEFGRALPGALAQHDHGNHVLGIMCAKHNDLGVRGVLPNCSAAVSSGAFKLGSFSPGESGDDRVSGFSVLFSELVATTLDFIVAHPDVKTINLSLGFNWLPNFGIDPRAPDAEAFRNMIRVQGRFFASVLALAKQHDIAIVSAAGNDSSTLPTPLPAMWASPFNFGAFLIESLDGWSNGIVVEAHRPDGRRAGFSNAEGHISCPGVNVLSTLASAPNAYGLLSGTSMASPYCAAGIEALRRLRPEVTLQAAIDCFKDGPTQIDGTVPRLDLVQARESCAIGPTAGLAGE